MDNITRYADATAQLSNQQQRLAGVLEALAYDQMGTYAKSDPGMLDQFLSSRGAPTAVKLLVKAAVAAGATSDSTWAGPLAAARPGVAAHLASVDRIATLPRLGAPKVPSTNVVGAAQTAGAAAYWVGEAGPKPMTSLAYAALSLTPRKVVADIAASAELLRVANVDFLTLLERAAMTAVATAWDTAVWDPANAGIANIKPASLTNGLVAITPAGDYQNQAGQVLAGISGGAPTNPVLLVDLQGAVRLTALRDLAAIGVRVIVTPAAGGRLIAVDADGVAWSDDGGELKIGEPDYEASDTPTATSVAATVMISAFQRNLKVLRSERFVTWAKRADAVAYLTLA